MALNRQYNTLDLPIFGKTQRFSQEISTKTIRKAVMDGRRLKVLPSSEWLKYPWQEIRMLMHEIAVYVLPTEELLDYLDELIGDEKAIEICAGTGNIGRNLDIVMTDSYQQRDHKLTNQLYKLTGQPVIQYPKDVIKCDAYHAVRRMKPHTVVGCYATHKWREDTQDGNDRGVDFMDLFDHCERIILVGNKDTHKNNPLMAVPHVEMMLPGLITRAEDHTKNRIFIWEHIRNNDNK